jgi:hypothetical protein
MSGKISKNDIIASAKFKKTIEQFAIGSLKSPNGNPVASLEEAKDLAAVKTGQSYNQKQYADTQKKRKSADRYGNATREEIAEGERTSSSW